MAENSEGLLGYWWLFSVRCVTRFASLLIFCTSARRGHGYECMTKVPCRHFCSFWLQKDNEDYLCESQIEKTSCWHTRTPSSGLFSIYRTYLDCILIVPLTTIIIVFLLKIYNLLFNFEYILLILILWFVYSYILNVAN